MTAIGHAGVGKKKRHTPLAPSRPLAGPPVHSPAAPTNDLNQHKQVIQKEIALGTCCATWQSPKTSYFANDHQLVANWTSPVASSSCLFQSLAIAFRTNK